MMHQLLAREKTRPRDNYWILYDPGETIPCDGDRRARRFLAFLLSTDTKGATVAHYNRLKGEITVHLEGRWTEELPPSFLSCRLTAEEVHAWLTPEEKRLMVEKMGNLLGRPVAPYPGLLTHPVAPYSGWPFRVFREVLNLRVL